METSKRIGDLTSDDRAAVERAFGVRLPLESDLVIVLKTPAEAAKHEAIEEEDRAWRLWSSVLAGVDEKDVDELIEIWKQPVRFGHRE